MMQTTFDTSGNQMCDMKNTLDIVLWINMPMKKKSNTLAEQVRTTCK